jgi:2-dehydro-3-deoxyglucarate aldolase
VNAPYSSMPNTFRRDLLSGKNLIGCWASLASNITTEILGYSGFDWLLLDGEHAPNDYASFITQLQALKDSPSAPIVRPQWQDPVVIKRLLDIGFYNFLIPFIESAEQATRAVAATRYPPDGFRGVGTAHRSNRYGFNADYFKTINENICVTVQIESKLGVEAAADIAAVDGVDALFIGPSDLSAAYGVLLQPNLPEVQAAIQKILAGAQKHGKACGILAPVEADARKYLEMGMTFVAVGGDTGLLRGAAVALAQRFKVKD